MTIAAKHLDPVIGIDVHIVQPPGPVPPVPVPHPHVGMVLDPSDYIPGVCTVYINNLPRATAGSAGMAVPPHIPLGGVFVKPPSNESTVFMGSATVTADGEPLSYFGLPVLTCQDVGMPAPPRAKRKAPKSLMLPTSVVLSIPAGPLVLVGGPPTILMPGLDMLVMPVGLRMAKALKALAKKSSKAFKAARKVSSRALHKAAAKAMDKLGLGDRARNRVHRAICTVTGHPVDVATGKMFTEHVDFELGGPLPLRWERVWYSTSRQPGPLGVGWHHSYDLALIEVERAVAVRLADGRVIALPRVRDGETYFDRTEKLTIGREKGIYALWGKDGLVHRFSAAPTGGDPHVLASIEDRSGNRISFEHDRRGRLSGITDSSGRRLKMRHDEEGRIVEVTGPHPTETGKTIVLVSYAYDRFGNLALAANALRQPMRYEYAHGLLVKETNRNGLSFHFQYDGTNEKARCTRTWGEGFGARGIYDHKLTYDVAASLTVVENSLGHKTTQHDRNGLVWKTVDASGGSSLSNYDEHNDLVSAVDPLERETVRTYDERGNLASVTGPDGTTVSLLHDGRDLLVGATDALGGAWRWEHDERGRVTARVDALGNRTTFEHGPRHLAAVTDPLGARTAFHYDPAGNLISVRTADGAFSRWVHDGHGRVVAAIDPKGNTQLRTLDVLGRPVRVDEPDGNVRQLAYDPEGNVVHAKDRQREVAFTYAGMNRLAARTEAGTTVRFDYDTEEQLTGIRNEHGLVYAFQLGPTGVPVAEQGFDGLLRRYQHDIAGRVTRVERPGAAWTAYRHDDADRIVGVEHSDGTKESFKYRPDGALVAASNGSGQVKLERDALGRVVKETQGGHAIESVFDERGLRAAYKSSLGAVVAIERNVMGDVIGLDAGGGPAVPSVARGEGDARGDGHGSGHRYGDDGALRLSFERDVAGLEMSRSLPGGIQVRWERDKLGRPLKQEVWAGHRVERARQYTWTFDDRLQRIVDTLRGPAVYTHDGLGNLIAAEYADGVVERRLPDAVGNLFRAQDRRDRVYGPAGQLLEERTNTGIVSYGYDVEGNRVRKTTSQGQWRYEWNAAGMLTRVVRPDGETVEMAYDALGRRLWKKYRGKITRWVWDGNVPLHQWVELEGASPEEDASAAAVAVTGALVDEIAASRRKAALNELSPQGPPSPRPDEGTPTSPITWLFEPESFTPVAKVVAGARFGIVTDHLGTPTAMYDDGGQEVWSASIGIWGDLRHVDGRRDAVPFRWPGQYEDEETGLYCNRFRHYDPEAGTYVSGDPIGIWGGLRGFSYATDSTVIVDPFGLTCTPSLEIERKRQAYKFYRAIGFSPRRSFDHMKGTDFTKPVDFISLRKGEVYQQHRFPSARVGNYFSDVGTPASRLGIYPHGRLTESYVASKDIAVMRSTAADAWDTWSVPGQRHFAPGGGTQYVVPDPSAMAKL